MIEAAPGSRSHGRPFLRDDRPAVADQFTREVWSRLGGHQLSGFEQLQRHERLGLGAAPRIVVLREREEDDEPQEEREPGRQDAEDPRCSVAVLEAAAVGGTPAHQQHRGDHDRRHPEDDQDRPDQRHRDPIGSSVVRVSTPPVRPAMTSEPRGSRHSIVRNGRKAKRPRDHGGGRGSAPCSLQPDHPTYVGDRPADREEERWCTSRFPRTILKQEAPSRPPIRIGSTWSRSRSSSCPNTMRARKPCID